jgi:hypothetical protein
MVRIRVSPAPLVRSVFGVTGVDRSKRGRNDPCARLSRAGAAIRPRAEGNATGIPVQDSGFRAVSGHR